MTDDERDDPGSPGSPGDNERSSGGRPPSGGGGFGDRGRGAPGGGGNARDRGFARSGPGGRPAGGGGGGGFGRDRGFSGDRRPFSGGGGSRDRPFRGGDRPGGPPGAGGGSFGRDRREGGDDRPVRGGDRSWSDRPPRPFDRGGDRDHGGPGGFARDDRPRRGGFGDSGDRPFRDRPQGDRPQRPQGDRPQRPQGDRPQRPYGDRPPRPYEDRQDRPQSRFGGGQREGFSGDRGSGGGRSFGARPAGGGWQDRGDRVERVERDERPERDGRPERERGGPGDDRPSYRSAPRVGSRDAWRPENRDNRFSRGSWQDRSGRGPDRHEAGSGDALASPELLADDEELVCGRRPVAEAFSARRPAKRLLVVPERRQALEQLVLHATALRIPVVEVEGGTLTSVSGFDGHQGIALVVEPRRWATLDDVLARAAERGEPPLILVLDSFEDPQNVGTLLRTAEANGVHGVIFPTRRSAPISPAAIKTSAGATEHLLLVPLDDLAGGLVDLRSRGLRVVGADEDAQLSYRDADLRGPLALVVGSEGQGISGVVHRRLDLAVRIPMRGKIASLNAAVAGSVLLFEAASQRGTPETDRGALASGQTAGLLAVPTPTEAESATPTIEPEASAPKPKRGRKAKAEASDTAEPVSEPEVAGAAAEKVEFAVEQPKPERGRKAKPEAEPVKVKRGRKAKSEEEPKGSTSASAATADSATEAAAEPPPKVKRPRKPKAEPAHKAQVDDLLPEVPPAE